MLAFASGQVFGKFPSTLVVISGVGRDQGTAPKFPKDHLIDTFLDNKGGIRNPVNAAIQHEGKAQRSKVR